MQLNAKWNILKENPCPIIVENQEKKIIEGEILGQG